MTGPQIIIIPMLVALTTAIITLLTRGSPRIQRVLSLLGGVGYLVAVGELTRRVLGTGIMAYQLSNWPAPFGITLVADELSVFMLSLAALVALAAVTFSAFYIESFGQRLSYQPLFHFMLVGVSGSFLTGDIFNLFVWFEVMLMPSYVLVVFYSGPEHTRAGLYYTVLNLLGSAVMLVAIGGLYSTTGTLNMADMARRLANAGEYGIDPGPVLGLSALLFAVFALKAGIFPFQFWVPSAYRAAPAPVSAVLAGITKKVGIYAIIRLYFTIFAAASLPAGLGVPGLTGSTFLAFFGPVMFLMAGASIILGGLGAVAQPDLDGVFAHSSIGQVGFIVLPLAVGATATAAVSGQTIPVLAVTAALVYSLNHAVAKALLFMASGTVFETVGSTEFRDLGGLTTHAPILSGVFFVGGLALVGIPPLSGFFGKMLVFDTAGRAAVIDATFAPLALAVVLGGAVLTIVYVSRTWNRGFWGEPTEMVVGATRQRGLLTVVALLAVTLLAIGVGFDPIYSAAEAAGEAAVDTQGYVDAVDPTTAETALNETHSGNATGHQAGHSAGADGGGHGHGHTANGSEDGSGSDSSHSHAISERVLALAQ